MAKELWNICAGPVHAKDKRWFTELSNKGMFLLEIFIYYINGTSHHSARCTKVHLYWCMRNCGGNPDHQRAMI